VGTLREQISQLEATIEARDAQIQELNTTHTAEVFYFIFLTQLFHLNQTNHAITSWRE